MLFLMQTQKSHDCFLDRVHSRCSNMFLLHTASGSVCAKQMLGARDIYPRDEIH
jgi:hypothetical protein